jgi:hypothetical protein
LGFLPLDLSDDPMDRNRIVQEHLNTIGRAPDERRIGANLPLDHLKREAGHGRGVGAVYFLGPRGE